MQLHHTHSDLPVAVIGAGPVGLAAASRLADDGIPFIVFEAGPEVGASIRRWGHVRLFSPWRYLIDESARARLGDTAWESPDPDGIPVGTELVRAYVEPLAAHPELAPYIELGSRVRAISRAGVDKLTGGERGDRPFAVHVDRSDGGRAVVTARAVIDASGTYESPNPLGTSGVPAAGEAEAASRLFYGIPDVRGADRARFAGARVGVVGSGHSAFNALLDLADLPEAERPHVSWFVRSRLDRRIFGGEGDDALTERGALGRKMRLLAESGALTVRESFRTASVETSDDSIVLRADDGTVSTPLDVVVVVTGFRPDLSITREVRVALDPAVEAPVALAPLIDPNLHSCGTVPPHGFRELSHPDDGYYTVGMKSYGRAPTFLLMTGYEQVRSVVKAIAGDLEAAARVELVLPETGVCNTDPAISDAGACCAPAEPASTCCDDDAETGAYCAVPAPGSIGLTRARR